MIPPGRAVLAVAVVAAVLVAIATLPSTTARAQGPPLPDPGTRLLVATKRLEPFVIEGPDGSLSGFSVDLWEEVASRLELDYQWLRVDTVADQLQAVQEGTADLAVAGISMTMEREQLVDFSHAYYNSGLQILASARTMPSVSDVFLAYAPNLLRIAAAALLLTVVMAHAIWLVERRADPDFPQDYLRGVAQGIWLSFEVVSQAEYRDRPVEGARRLLVVALWVVGVVFVAHFTATITAALTIEHLSSAINGPEDLAGRRVATVAHTTADGYLTDLRIAHRNVATVEEAIDLLESDAVDAVVYDAPVLHHYAANEGRNTTRVAGPVFRHEPYGIAMAPGSPYREPINEVLLEIWQDGTYDRLHAEWFGGD